MTAAPGDVEPRVALIAARARNGVIGRRGGLPWRLSGDMGFFKRATMGKPVLMGRKTWDSLPKKPLPGRPNLVLSRDPALAAAGAEAFTSFEAMLARARTLAAESGAEEVVVIGGAALYALALPEAGRLYLTEVAADPIGDAFFPAFDANGWETVAVEAHDADDKNEHAFLIRTLDRAGARPHGRPGS